MSFNFNDLKITNSIKKEGIILTLLNFPKDLINPEIDGINQKIQAKINANATDSNLNTIIDEYIDKIHEQLIIKKNIFVQETIKVSEPTEVSESVHPFELFNNRRINRIVNPIVSSDDTPINNSQSVSTNKILQHYRYNLLLRKKH